MFLPWLTQTKGLVATKSEGFSLVRQPRILSQDKKSTKVINFNCKNRSLVGLDQVLRKTKTAPAG